MPVHTNHSSSVSEIPPMNFRSDELPSFSLGLTQDEEINLISTNFQSKRGVSKVEVRSNQHNDSEKIVEIMKRKALRKSLSPKSTTI